MKHRNQSGFTIIELLIATTVVSVVLLLVSIIMINIGNLYYKGITQSRVQSNVRDLTDELSQHLELTNLAPDNLTSPNGSIYRLCAGDTMYTYTIGKQIGDTNDTYHSKQVLWRTKINPGSCKPETDPAKRPPDNFLSTTPTDGGTELIAPHSRLVAFCVGTLSGGTCTPDSTSPYPITISVVYGDEDLLCAPSLGSNTCSDTSGAGFTPAELATGDLKCKGKQGDSFCATATLSTTATQRLN